MSKSAEKSTVLTSLGKAKLATGNDVREFARSKGHVVGTRGRLDEDHIAEFNKAMKGKRKYVEPRYRSEA